MSGRDWETIAGIFASRIAALDAEVVTLMRNHASTKAAGPAHTAAYLDSLARQLIGPTWRDLVAHE